MRADLPWLRLALPAAIAAALSWPCLAGPVAHAGPVEAREAWEQARLLAQRPWRERVRAYRAVRQATHARDPLRARALSAEARVLRQQGRVHAAAALEAWATAATPEHEPERAARCDAQAGLLHGEGDVHAARACWEEAERRARREQPWRADEALEALARLAAEQAEHARLRSWCLHAEAVKARPSTRVALWGAWGLLALAQGGTPGLRAAEQALAHAATAFEQSARADPREALRASKAWLDLPLRQRLAPSAGPRAR